MGRYIGLTCGAGPTKTEHMSHLYILLRWFEACTFVPVHRPQNSYTAHTTLASLPVYFRSPEFHYHRRSHKPNSRTVLNIHISVVHKPKIGGEGASACKVGRGVRALRQRPRFSLRLSHSPPDSHMQNHPVENGSLHYKNGDNICC